LGENLRPSATDDDWPADAGAVSGLSGVRWAAGGAHSLALLTDGTLPGRQRRRPLGDGTTTER
jgi:hypothetical protein